MKAVQALSTVVLAASAVLAAPEPARVAARATSSGTGSSSLPTITTSGKAFWQGKSRFYIRGIDYQPGGASGATDPLANPTTCQRDIKYFQELGVNTIRVYTVDNSANHDECMQALAEAGIYLALDVNTPGYSLNRNSPGESYNPAYLQSIFSTIDAFAGYTNTLLFFSGNEVINAPNTTNTAPFIKAVTRDMKQYISERGYRAIPVGYSAADVSQNQYLMAQYMDCGEKQTLSDFYAINNYEWCDPSSFTTSGWDALVEQYANYSLPVFMSEYGCITNTRTFEETNGLYQPDMTKAFSGGLVYEYSEEGNGYGIVTIGSSGSVTPVGSQFTDLKNQLAKTPNPSGDGGLLTNGVTQDCPSGSDWDISPFSGSALPAMPSGAVSYLKSGAGKAPGLNGPGSQDAPGGSTVTASAGAGVASQTFGNGAAAATGANGAATSSSAASPSQLGHFEMAPLVCGLVVAISMGFGAALL